MGTDLRDIEKVGALKGLKIFLWNIRSLFPKIDIVLEFVGAVAGIGLLCINETWLKPELTDGLICMNGYTIVRNDRVPRRGGGSCIYVNKRLNYEKLADVVNIKDIELMCIILNGDGLHSQRKICVILVYRPPGGDSNIAFSIIEEYMHNLNEIYKCEIIVLV